MREKMAKLIPSSWLIKKILMAAVLVGACVAAFCWGRKQSANAQQGGLLGEPGKAGSYDPNQRIVAYLGQNHAISREELGEYLIARFGAERLEFLVNRKIVEMECKKHNIFVTDAEVEERFRRDLNSFGTPLTPKDFETNVLRRFNKTMYEWKEDVIRPKIMMEKLVRSQVQITEKDIQDGFEARYGPKVQCRMIVIEKGNLLAVQNTWNEVRKGRDQFIEKAKSQFVPNLAQSKGEVPPIHKHFGDKSIEETAFRLKVGEVSEPLRMQDGTTVILLCEKHLPADISVQYKDVRMQIHREVQELKVAQKIPEVFTELRKAANPRLVLGNAVHHIARVENNSSLSAFEQQQQARPSTLSAPPPPVPTKLTPPAGTAPVQLPNAAPAPISVLPPIGLKLDPPAPTEKK